jgi:hypothetical protein
MPSLVRQMQNSLYVKTVRFDVSPKECFECFLMFRERHVSPIVAF